MNSVKAPLYVIPKEILFADHFTDDSARALGYARAVALRFGSHVTITYVRERESPIATPEGSILEGLGYSPPDLETQLVQHVESLRASGVAADPLKRTGSVVRELIDSAKERSADLMVLGTHAPHGLDRLFFGSESEKTADESGWPVMVVGPKVRPVPKGGWNPGRILCLLQPSECSVAAAIYGVKLSHALGCRTTFLMIEPEGGELTEDAAEFGFALTEELPGINLNQEIERVQVSEPGLLEDVLDRSQDEQVGAIVVCSEVEDVLHTHGPQTLLSKLLSVMPCPVIVMGRCVDHSKQS